MKPLNSGLGDGATAAPALEDHRGQAVLADQPPCDERKEGDVPCDRALKWFVRTCFPSRASVLLAFTVCIAIPMALLAVHIHENPLLSPIDEGAHYDYVNQLASGHFPRLGDRMLPTTLRTIACTGNDLPGAVFPSCTAATLHASQFPGGGFSYEAQQPPLYYAATVPMRWAAVHLLGLGNLTGTRALGAVWLVLGLLMLWAAGRLLGAHPKVLGAAVLLVAVAPVVIYETSIVSDSAGAVFAGSGLGLAGALAWSRPGRWVPLVLFLVGVIAAAIIEIDVLAAVVVAFLLAIAAHGNGGRVRAPSMSSEGWLRTWARSGGAMLLGSLVAIAAWTVISRKLSLIDPRTLPSFAVLRGHPVGLSLIAREAVSMFSPGTDAFSPFRTNDSLTVPASSVLSTNLQPITATGVQYLLLGGGLAGLFVTNRRWNHWIGLATLPVLYVGGIVLGVGLWLTYNTDPGLSGRYGLALVPFLAIAVAASCRGAWTLRGVWLFALLTCGLSFVYMLSG